MQVFVWEVGFDLAHDEPVLAMKRGFKVPQKLKPSPAGPAKIADVAKLAGVSTATVSRTLANPNVVSPLTRERVLKAVDATQYTPNLTARNLRAKRTGMVLALVPNIANPFFAEVLHGIEERLSGDGYGLIIGNLDNSPDKEAHYVELVLAGQVDGVLLLNGHVPSSGARKVTSSGLAIVAACEVIDGETFPQVEVQNEEAALAVTRHLIGLGHRRLSFLAGPPGNVLVRARKQGFERALLEARIKPATARMFAGDFTFKAGLAAAESLRSVARDDWPTGLVAANDEMAIGFIKGLREQGVDVPHEVSVVGFDDIDFALFSEPALTTMRQPRHEIGVHAASRLIELMGGDFANKAQIERLPASLIIRESTARALPATKRVGPAPRLKRP